MKKYIIGIMFCLVHFILEVTCFYTLAAYTSSNLFPIIALMYDLFAFVPQGLIGAFSDKFRKVHIGIIGLVLTLFALISLKFNLPVYVIFTLLTIGNALVHVEGAESTLRTSEGKMFPSALFVAGGAFGIITGKLLFQNNISVEFIMLANVIALLIAIIAYRFRKDEDNKLEEYNYDNTKINTAILIILAVFVVAVRSYSSYGIPTGWNKTTLQTILLFCFMGIGKALGGLLIDKTNIKVTSIVSTVLALPFLLFGNHNMYLSLIGIMLFSMTMPVTLAILVSRLKKSPGIAFGLTTIGLFIGCLPAFLFTIDSLLINGIVFTILTILCTIILVKIEK
ncbi:MAG: hypothetical protein IKZ96_03785 [Bacilli bacterium]|nr:hypothetical protein [Bacilli bacterium]